MKSSEEDIIRFVVSFSKGELTAEELLELRKELTEDESKKAIFKKHLKLYGSLRGIGSIDKIEGDDAWKKINKRINTPAPRRVNLFSYIAYAASIIMILTVGGYLYFSNVKADRDMAGIHSIQPGTTKAVLTLSDGSVVDLSLKNEEIISEKFGNKIIKDSSNNLIYNENGGNGVDSKEVIYNTIRVPRGGEYSLKLSDGTKVWLNSETVFRFPVDFVGKTRRVYVRGEAFFDVEHDKKKPFIVDANGSTVKVLGTRFNVQSYKGEDAVVTTLVQGKVRVANNYSKTEIRPGQQSVVYKDSKDIKVREVDASVYMAWIRGVFEFEDMSLEYIVSQLERWYEVEFVFADESLKKVRFTGAAGKDKRLSYVLEMIEELSKVKFEMKGEKIIIR